jgi:hypothetical protein
MVSKQTIQKWDSRLGICLRIPYKTQWAADQLATMQLKRDQDELLTMKESILLNEIYNKISG